MIDDDAALLVAVGEGSQRAFNQFIDRHQQALRAFLRTLSARDADDIAQDTFLAVWSNAKSFAGRASVRSWLFAIAWRKAKDAQRSWFRRRRRDTFYHESAMDAGKQDAGLGEDTHAFDRALRQLPQEQRAAVVLCLGWGLSHAEAAEALEMPLGTVKSHVLRGRTRLREVLGVDHDP